MELLQARIEKIGPPWKVGNEFLPYHPSASHVSPEHRDGWNYCYLAARADAEKSATPEEVIELTAALEIRAILEQIKEVAAAVHVATMPTPFQAAWHGCCEEIFFRATGQQWHMDEDDGKRKVQGPTAGDQIVQRALDAR